MKRTIKFLLFSFLFLFVLASCNVVIDVPEDHVHSYDIVEFDENGHWFFCSCGEKKNNTISKHEYVEKVETAATCKTAGLKSYTCSVCGYSYNEPTPMLTEHVWNNGEVITPATCISDGEMIYTCTSCGDTKTEPIPVDANAHSWDSGVVTTDPTCTSDGVMTYTCAFCGDTKTEPIPNAGPHIWSEGVVTTDPTCNSEGVLTFTCSKCGGTKTEPIPIDANAHSWGEGEITTPATCKSEGVRTYTCLLCSDTKTEPIPMLTEHTWDSGVVTKDAKVGENGEITYTCTVCGATKVETFSLGLNVKLVRSTFVVGQYLEYTDISVVEVGVESITHTDFTFDLEGVQLTTAHTEVVVTFDGVEYHLPISVVEASEVAVGLDLILERGYVHTSDTKILESLIYAIVYSDGSKSEYKAVSEKELQIKQVGGSIEFVVSTTVGGKALTASKTIVNPETGRTLITPDKLLYTIGEELDLTGACVKVSYQYGNPTYITIDSSMLTLGSLDMNANGDYELIATVDGNDFTFVVSVRPSAKSIEIVEPLGSRNFIAINKGLEGVAALFKEKALKVTYTDDSFDFFDINAGMLSSAPFAEGTLTVTLSSNGFELTFDVEVIPEFLQVSESYSATGTFKVIGVVVGYSYKGNATMSTTNASDNYEIILKDLNNDTIVMVNKGGMNWKIGDIISLTAETYSGSSNEANRRIYTPSNVKLYKHTDNTEIIQLSLEDAIDIGCQQDLRDLFSSTSAFKENMYKVLRLHGNFGFIPYSGVIYRLCMGDVTDYSGSKPTAQVISGTNAPTIKSNVFELNTGLSFEETFGDSANGGYANIIPAGFDMYVICTGGTGTYYLDFVCLGSYMITDMEPLSTGKFEITGLESDTLHIGNDFDFSNIAVTEIFYESDDNQVLNGFECVPAAGFDKNVPGTYTINIVKDGAVVTTFKVTYVDHEYGELVPAVKFVDCTEASNIAYYYCVSCDLYFNENKEVVSADEVFRAATEHSFGAYSHNDGTETHTRICSVCLKEETSPCSYIGEEGEQYCEFCSALKPISHVHVYTMEVIDAKYLAHEATCESHPLYYYSCSCGEFSTENGTFEDVETPALEHDYSVSYDWINENTECIAYVVCANDADHNFEVHGSVQKVDAIPNTCETPGTHKFVATFDSELCETQETEEFVNTDYVPVGHEYKDVTYELITDASTLKDCDKVTFVAEYNGKYYSLGDDSGFHGVEITLDENGNAILNEHTLLGELTPTYSGGNYWSFFAEGEFLKGGCIRFGSTEGSIYSANTQSVAYACRFTVSIDANGLATLKVHPSSGDVCTDYAFNTESLGFCQVRSYHDQYIQFRLYREVKNDRHDVVFEDGTRGVYYTCAKCGAAINAEGQEVTVSTAYKICKEGDTLITGDKVIITSLYYKNIYISKGGSTAKTEAGTYICDATYVLNPELCQVFDIRKGNEANGVRFVMEGTDYVLTAIKDSSSTANSKSSKPLNYVISNANSTYYGSFAYTFDANGYSNLFATSNTSYCRMLNILSSDGVVLTNRASYYMTSNHPGVYRLVTTLTPVERVED